MPSFQCTLDLFPAPDFPALCTQGRYRHIRVVVKPRLRKKWYVTLQAHCSERVLYIPRCCDAAPQQVKEALLQWACCVRRGRKSSLVARQKKKQCEQVIFAFLHSVHGETPNERGIDPFRTLKCSRGRVYELCDIFNELNEHYFQSSVSALVRWGRPGSRTSYQKRVRLRSGGWQDCITIAGVYNHPDVPLFALRGIMYHEMLHCVYPPRMKNGRRQIHHPEFIRAEQAFEEYGRWRDWERCSLPGLRGAYRRGGSR